MGVKVKALEWSEAREPNKECSYNHMRAMTEFGTYSIEWKGWKEYDSFVVYLNVNTSSHLTTHWTERSQTLKRTSTAAFYHA